MIESFSNNVLKQLRKIFTKEIAERVIGDTYRAGINVVINIIVGFPGETEEDSQETIGVLKINHKYISLSSLSVCLANPDSCLDDGKYDYGLIFPSDEKNRAKKWKGLDGKNTYELRKARAEKIIDLLKRLHVTCERVSI